MQSGWSAWKQEATVVPQLQTLCFVVVHLALDNKDAMVQDTTSKVTAEHNVVHMTFRLYKVLWTDEILENFWQHIVISNEALYTSNAMLYLCPIL